MVSFILAAFPFSSRRKYSLARRTRAARTRSTFAIVGECNGDECERDEDHWRTYTWTFTPASNPLPAVVPKPDSGVGGVKP